MCTIAEKLVSSFQDGEKTIGQLAIFCRDSGLVVHSDISDKIDSDFYTFVDSSVLEINWIKSKAYA